MLFGENSIDTFQEWIQESKCMSKKDRQRSAINQRATQCIDGCTCEEQAPDACPPHEKIKKVDKKGRKKKPYPKRKKASLHLIIATRGAM